MGFKNLVSNYRSQFEPVKIVAFPETIILILHEIFLRIRDHDHY